MPVKSSDTTNDQKKFIQEELIERSELLHRIPQFCEPVTIPQGSGKSADFVKYNRTDVPVDKISEGVTPSETPFTVSKQSVTVDEWGLYIGLTDVAVLTTNHPILNEALDLVADAMSRCVDYTIAEILNDGTNVQYWDGTRANRAAVAVTDTFKGAVFNRSRSDLNDKGARPRYGDLFAVVMGPQVEADILAETAAVGGFQAAHQNNGNEKLEKGVVGDWLGYRIIRSNFVPKFTRIATVGAPAAGAGGALSGTVYHKVTRKSLSRGFEEDIQVEASTAMGGNNRLTFTAPSTAGYVYNIYAGTSTGDANLFLAKENLAASGTYALDAVPTSGQTAPETPASGVTVHPMYMFAMKAVDNVTLTGAQLNAGITPKGRTDSDPSEQRRKVGAKWMHKAGIRSGDYFKRVELALNF